ncbi:MAG: phosphoserine phosphatase SerB [Microbacteriaceae bacterium]|nr:phosphoserine phosphatase SerB [Microbacteriaceae bacterium]
MTRFLVVFDVDSTLIEDEVIELLADCAGKRAEVAEITERAMQGELDFAESLEARVATLAGLPSDVIGQTLDRIRITRGAASLIEAVHERGGKVGAVSGGFNQLLEPLAKILQLDFWRANQLEITAGILTGKVVGKIVDRQAKAEALVEWAAACEVPISKTIAVGDGANDLDMMAQSGLSVAFNSKPKVRQAANLVVGGNDLSALIPLLP